MFTTIYTFGRWFYRFMLRRCTEITRKRVNIVGLRHAHYSFTPLARFEQIYHLFCVLLASNQAHVLS